jgi:hypothetical protein
MGTEDTEDFLGWVNYRSGRTGCHPRLGRSLASTERGPRGVLAIYPELHITGRSLPALKRASGPSPWLRPHLDCPPGHPKKPPCPPFPSVSSVRCPLPQFQAPSQPHRLQRDPRIRGQHLIQDCPARFIHALEGMKINGHNLRRTSFEQSCDGVV